MSVALKKLTQDLDSSMGGIESLVSTLADVEIEFSQLVDSMDKAQYTGQESAYYSEHFRKIRVLNRLMQYLMDDLNRESEKAGKISYTLCEQFIGNEGRLVNNG
jgi:hypothetical protein